MSYFTASLRLLVVLLLATAAGCSREGKVSNHLKKAAAYYENRDFEQAKIEYINVLKLERTNSVAIRNLGNIFFAQDQWREAFPLLLRSRELFPDDQKIREQLVTITAASTNAWRDDVAFLLRQNPTNEIAVLTLAEKSVGPAEIQQCEKTLAELRARSGDQAVFHVAEAVLWRRRGEPQKAEAAIRRAVALAPRGMMPNMVLGNLLWTLGRTNDAAAALTIAAESSPPYGTARLRLAHFLLQTGRTPEAKTVLDGIIANAPERTRALTLRAEVALGDKQFDESGRLLDRALSQSPGDFEAGRLRGQVLLAKNQPTQAVQQLEQMVKMYPKSAQLLYELGLAQLLNKNITQAMAHLKAALAVDAGLPNANLLLAELNLARGETAEAILLLTGLSKKYPELAQAKFLLARAYHTAGRLDDAAGIYGTLRQKYPQNPAPPLQLGLVLRQQGKSVEARRSFEESVKLDPIPSVAFEQLVGLDLEAKDYSAATRRIEAALVRDPKAPSVWYLKAKTHLAQKQVAEAEVALKQAMTAAPDFQPAMLTLAEVYAGTGRTKDAIGELERVVAGDPNNSGAFVLLGLLQAQDSQNENARKSYERALALRPQSPAVLNNLAHLLAERLNLPKEARPHALKARQLAPDDPAIADTMGWIEYRLGDYAEALRLISDSAEKLPLNPEVQYHLGMAAYMSGSESVARAALEIAVKSPEKFAGKDIAQLHLDLLRTDSKFEGDQLAALEKRCKETPTDIIALTRLGDAYLATAAYPKAVQAFEQALAINPKSVSLLLRLARLQAEQLNNPTGALELARKARTLAPNDPAVAVTLGRLALTAGDQAWAYSLLQDGSRGITNRTDVSFDLAWAAYGLGRVDEANQLMQQVARSAGPTNQINSARWFLAMTALAGIPSGLLQAEPQIAQLLQADPAHGPALFAAGLLAEQQGKAADARQSYEKLLRRYPAFTPAIRQLVILLTALGTEDAKAYELATKARTALPKDAALAAALGKLACRKADYRYAAQLLKEAGQTQKSDAELFYYLGVAHRRLEEKPASKTALEKALQMDPKAKFAPDAKQLLKEVGGA